MSVSGAYKAPTQTYARGGSFELPTRKRRYHHEDNPSQTGRGGKKGNKKRGNRDDSDHGGGGTEYPKGEDLSY